MCGQHTRPDEEVDESGFEMSQLQVIPVMYRWELIPGAGTLAGMLN